MSLKQLTLFLSVALLLPQGAFGQKGDHAGEAQPETWRKFDVPEAPVLSPQQALTGLHVAPGFRVELVAAEPLVEDPVAIAWDASERLWVVEMRGFMPDVDGRGETEPVGQVVVLVDDDRDGGMDRSTVFLGGLVNPRAIAPVRGGVLIAEPPNLWWARDIDGDLVCDTKDAVTKYGDPNPDHLEHTENGLLWALDNWIYSAKSNRRLRFKDGKITEEKTLFRGQWGIAQDDQGRLYYNSNSSFLYGDFLPSELATQNPNAGKKAGQVSGVARAIARDESVFTMRVNPGINRGYQDHMLRKDGRLARTTSVSGLTVYRGDQFPQEYRGDGFVPEPAGNVVAHFRLSDVGHEIDAEHRLYADPRFGKREFLASEDERFRPVDCAVGPDGALYVVDMYRGILQHRQFVTTFLRKQILERGLDKPLGLGRIYRVVHDTSPVNRVEPILASLAPGQRVAELESANGWRRDTAQRMLVEAGDVATVPALRKLASTSSHSVARMHALWTLHGMNALDVPTVQAALKDDDPTVRIAALRTSSALSHGATRQAMQTALLECAKAESDPRVQVQLAFSLGAFGDGATLAAQLQMLEHHSHDPYLRLAALNTWTGREGDILIRLRARFGLAKPPGAWDLLREIETAAAAAGSEKKAAATPDALTPELQKLVELSKPLRPQCSLCHGPSGQGVAALGPPLVNSPRVVGSGDDLVRIVLHGIEGPLEVAGTSWNHTMPGNLGRDDFTDEGIAGLLTWMRTTWGHEASPVTPADVQRVRERHAGRTNPWTIAELEALGSKKEPAAVAESAWVDLFNGRDLTGWVKRGGKATYRVDGDMIVGTTAPNTPNTFLCTERTYSDFVLEYEFNVDPELNSGVQIRSLSDPNYYNGAVHGYQVEIDGDEKRKRFWTGGIYDESRKGWLCDLKDKPEARAAFRPRTWNHIRVVAVGDSLRTWVNGVPAADLIDTQTRAGFIGLQVHGVGARVDPLEVRWRRLRIRELPAQERKVLLGDSKGAGDLSAWEPASPNGRLWSVSVDQDKNDGEQGTWTVSPGSGSMQTRESYTDFRLHVEFRVPSDPTDMRWQERGNSGVYLQRRYEVQILDSYGRESTVHDCGALYGVRKPDQNAALPAGEWQSYDIWFRAPRWSGDQKTENARVTVEWNGKRVHNLVEVSGSTGAGRPEEPEPAPILLQDHGRAVQYRNIWIEPLPSP